jgi:hypothetical protein
MRMLRCLRCDNCVHAGAADAQIYQVTVEKLVQGEGEEDPGTA